MTATAACRPDVEPAASPTISRGMMFTFATACGLVGANLYYGQPLAGPISNALGFDPAATGLIVTLTQIGYGLGQLLIVPLGDLLENRRLVTLLVSIAALALLSAAFATSPVWFLTAALCIGLASTAVQVLVPFAASMATDAERGRVVGNVMGGLLTGIMLARPVASFLSEISSWQAVYIVSAVVMVVLTVVLRSILPVRRPQTKLHYGQLLASMGHLALHRPVLQRRALYQASLFGAFSLFWTTTPLLLASPAYGLTQNGIALFALAGAAGAIASPIAGRLADRGMTTPATAFAILLSITAFLLAHLCAGGSMPQLALLTFAGILLDFGVQTHAVLGMRAIYQISGEHRSRLNGLYMASAFGGGAIGSAVGGWAYATGGWNLTSWIGLCFPLLALVTFTTEKRSRRSA
ncbi:MFS transporter [Rhizobium sp. RAF56]|uniref:MFS transporter n=1 Tax=Rhizobium sp. RAF56 TaxID=3233062 RepID=UPI003F959B57